MAKKCIFFKADKRCQQCIAYNVCGMPWHKRSAKMYVNDVNVGVVVIVVVVLVEWAASISNFQCIVLAWMCDEIVPYFNAERIEI